MFKEVKKFNSSSGGSYQFDVISRMNKMIVGREIRMHGIKEENEKLKAKIEELEKGVTVND